MCAPRNRRTFFTTQWSDHLRSLSKCRAPQGCWCCTLPWKWLLTLFAATQNDDTCLSFQLCFHTLYTQTGRALALCFTNAPNGCRPYFKNVFVLAFCRQIVGGPSALHFHRGSELHTWHSFPAPIGPRLHCVQCWTSLYLARGAMHFSSVQTSHQPQMSMSIFCGNSSVSLCSWLSWARSLRTFGCVGWPSHFAPTVQYFAYLGSALWSKHNCTIPYPIAGCLHGDHFKEPSIATVQSQSSACHRPSASVLWLIYSLGRWSVSFHSWPVLVAHAFCEPSFPKHSFFTYRCLLLMAADISWHFQQYSLVCHSLECSHPCLPHCWHLSLLNNSICCCLFCVHIPLPTHEKAICLCFCVH